jgi:hypothetical protein
MKSERLTHHFNGTTKSINIRKDFIELKEFKIRYENYYVNAEHMVVSVLIAVGVTKTPAIRNNQPQRQEKTFEVG